MKRFLPILFCLAAVNSTLAQRPLQVYILAGQSNMQGHAQVRTFEHIGMDERTAPLLREMQDGSGKANRLRAGLDFFDWARWWLGRTTWKAYRRIRGEWKCAEDRSRGYLWDLHGKDGCRTDRDHQNSVGGKSLHTDFRPPSAGPYVFHPQQLENLRKQGKDLDVVQAERAAATGKYYRYMLEHIQTVLRDLKRIYPDYDAQAGYRLAGFVWFQGGMTWLIEVSIRTATNPAVTMPTLIRFTHFIRDVRKDLSAPAMPFVIGVMGAGGPSKSMTLHKCDTRTFIGNSATRWPRPRSVLSFERMSLRF